MATVWYSFRGSIWHSMRRATAWPRRMPWSVWWSKAGPTKSRSRERLLVPRALCGGISSALRKADWLHWDIRTVIRLDARGVAAARERLVQRLKARGVGQREIARRIGVSEKAISKLLQRLGWKATPPAQSQLLLEAAPTADPNLSAFCATAENCVLSHDTDPSARCADRLLARLGLLEDAPPLFGSATAVPRAGVLLALPVLIDSGVFECAQKIYGSLGPAFYGLRTSLLTLLLMALWRIKRPEGLKEYSPQDLGDRKSTRLNSSHDQISYAVFCLKKKKQGTRQDPSERQRLNT